MATPNYKDLKENWNARVNRMGSPELDALIEIGINTAGGIDSETADVNSGIELNAATTVVIAAANPDRTYLHINNNSNKDPVWIKLQPASIDNDKKGIFLSSKDKPDGRWETGDNIYTGEVSAIAEKGSPTIYVTEY